MPPRPRAHWLLVWRSSRCGGTGIPWLFVVNAIGYVPTASALLNARTDAPADKQAQDEERPGSTSFAVALLVKASLGMSLFQFGTRAAHLADRKPFPVGSEIWPPTNGGTRL